MKFQIKRLLSQIFIFFTANLGALKVKTGFCYPFLYCHACPAADSVCPLKAIENSVYKSSFEWKLFFYPFLILGFFGILSGRAVCGWACPIGLLQRATGKTARKIKLNSFTKKIGLHKIESKLRYIKYFTLIGLVIATTHLIGFMFTDICPVGFLTGSLPILILNPDKYVPTSYFWMALVVFILFLILILLVERGWCRYFCPVGAILAPFNKISFLQVKVDKDKCVPCNKCSEVCPMGIDVPNMNRDPECILCGKCIDVCPQNAISFKKGGW